MKMRSSWGMAPGARRASGAGGLSAASAGLSEGHMKARSTRSCARPGRRWTGTRIAAGGSSNATPPIVTGSSGASSPTAELPASAGPQHIDDIGHRREHQREQEDGQAATGLLPERRDPPGGPARGSPLEKAQGDHGLSASEFSREYGTGALEVGVLGRAAALTIW